MTAAPAGDAGGPAAAGAALPRRLLAGYAVGSVGTATFSTVPGLLLLFFLTDTLDVAAGVAGLLLLVPKAWDVVLNPLVGVWCDRTAARTGTRTRWLLAGAVGLPVAFAAMFAVPVASPGAAAAWVGVAFLLAATAFSLFQVPYVALPAEISAVPDQRTRLMVWRMSALALGILVAGGLAPVLAESAGGGRAGHAAMGAALAVLLAAVLLACTRATRSVRAQVSGEPLGLRASWALARGNRGFFLLLVAYLLQTVAVSVMLAGSPYLASYRLGGYGLTSVLFVALVAPSLVAMPAWAAVARRTGKVPALLGATTAYLLVTATIAVTAGAGQVAAVVAQAALLGVCYAALQLLPFSLLPELIVADAGRTGRQQAGVFTGLWTAGETLGAAAGPAVYAAVLAATAFVSSSASEPVDQPASALTGVLAGFAVVPPVLLAASLPLLLALRRHEPRAGREPAGAPPLSPA